MTRVSALLGRTLVEADEAPGAPPVLVIGHDIWTERFSSDPAVVGRTVRLGNEQAAVVGVMPKGFAFPVAHSVWIPFPDDLRGPARGEDGPDLLVFGRLARHASGIQAQAELSAVGGRPVSDSPGTQAHLRPHLVQFGRLVFDPRDLQVGLAIGNAVLVMLLMLVSANVALLMFARAVTRESEIAVRSALGARRARILVQLFLEALVLASLAVAVGLAAGRVGLRSLLAALEADAGQPLPFWLTDTLNPARLRYAGALTILSAVIIGHHLTHGVPRFSGASAEP